MNDGPVIDFHDVLVAEVEVGGLGGLAKGAQNGENGLPQLVFHDASPLGSA
jgi:hypothetical protein